MNFPMTPTGLPEEPFSNPMQRSELKSDKSPLNDISSKKKLIYQ